MSKRTGQPNGPKSPWKYKVKEERRKQAESRQAKYDKLTIAQKIQKLDANGHVATKQRARLLKQLGE